VALTARCIEAVLLIQLILKYGTRRSPVLNEISLLVHSTWHASEYRKCSARAAPLGRFRAPAKTQSSLLVPHVVITALHGAGRESLLLVRPIVEAVRRSSVQGEIVLRVQLAALPI
jgi:hypothetical protein